MPELCDIASCNGCSACANACPKDCIRMVPDREGFLRPVIDETACVSCGLCEQSCPVLHPPALSAEEPTFWAAYNKDDQARFTASSGGIFTLLAQWVLERDGAVFGAAFQEDFSVAHRCGEAQQEVSAFCGSKYVQSKIGDTFRQAKALLEQGRYVVFSGTPCQIMGLRGFLKKDYPRLIAIDIICHGVPSPAVWQRYIQNRLETDRGGQLRSVTFRAKDKGWSGYETNLVYEETEYRVDHSLDPYMRGFLRNLYLRPSCSQCVAKGTRRYSDITLADLWGANRLCPELHDNKGTSFVLLHTETGKKIWQDIQPLIHCCQITGEAIQCNTSAIHSSTPHPNRQQFFSRFSQCGDLIGLITELTPDPVTPPPSLYRRIRGKLGRILRGR